MKERFLVTGASGFVASQLTRRLVENDCEVYPLIRPGSDTWRLEKIKFAEPLYVDITDYEALRRAVDRIKPTHIFHLATYGVYRDQRDEKAIHDVNVSGTTNILNAVKEHDLTLFVNTGSVYEYADLPGAMVESVIGAPRNPYDAAKIEATSLATEFAKSYHLPLCTLRLFTTYGPYEDERRLIPAVILTAMAGQRPVIAPEAIRDFVYIQDVLEAYLSTLNAKFMFGEVINIGSGQPYRIATTVETILNLLGTDLEPDFSSNYAPSDDSRCWADVSKARTILGWKPNTSLESGLQKTIAWFKTNHNLYRHRHPCL